MKLNSATTDDVLEGRVTDVYFRRTRQILEARGRNPRVRAEFVAKSLPEGWPWAVLAGLDEALEIVAELGVSARAMPEGSLFGPLEPVLEVEGPYLDFCEYETALLGCLCQASGVATGAARCRRAAGGTPIVSFGARRLHPSVAPVVERAAYLGGCDGVATIAGADLIDREAMGTIPHALILVLGDTVDATRAFHEVIDETVPRVSLIDTFQDEKFEAVRVADALGDDLDSVRLDTPATRKGDFFRLLEEVRWELDVRGFEDVELFVSGGIGEEEILRLDEFADGYGVGGAISAAPIVDFSMDIIEVEGEGLAKRGKWSGSKQVFRCTECGRRHIDTREARARPCRACGGETEPLLETAVGTGDVVREPERPDRVRDRVLAGLDGLPPLERP